MIEAKSNSEYDNLFGYTYFQQRKDTANARGFSQKSLVILSVFPFIQFFKGILDVMGASYFEAVQISEDETKDFLKVELFLKYKLKLLKRKTTNIS